jgi:hypothetical protein
MAEAAAILPSNMRDMLITSMMATSTILLPLAQRSWRNMLWKSVRRTLSVAHPIIIVAVMRPVINMDPVVDTRRYRTATT